MQFLPLPPFGYLTVALLGTSNTTAQLTPLSTLMNHYGQVRLRPWDGFLTRMIAHCVGHGGVKIHLLGNTAKQGILHLFFATWSNCTCATANTATRARNMLNTYYTTTLHSCCLQSTCDEMTCINLLKSHICTVVAETMWMRPSYNGVLPIGDGTH